MNRLTLENTKQFREHYTEGYEQLEWELTKKGSVSLLKMPDGTFQVGATGYTLATFTDKKDAYQTYEYRKKQANE